MPAKFKTIHSDMHQISPSPFVFNLSMQSKTASLQSLQVHHDVRLFPANCPSFTIKPPKCNRHASVCHEFDGLILKRAASVMGLYICERMHFLHAGSNTPNGGRSSRRQSECFRMMILNNSKCCHAIIEKMVCLRPTAVLMSDMPLPAKNRKSGFIARLLFVFQTCR